MQLEKSSRSANEDLVERGEMTRKARYFGQ